MPSFSYSRRIFIFAFIFLFTSYFSYSCHISMSLFLWHARFYVPSCSYFHILIIKYVCAIKTFLCWYLFHDRIWPQLLPCPSTSPMVLRDFVFHILEPKPQSNLKFTVADIFIQNITSFLKFIAWRAFRSIDFKKNHASKPLLNQLFKTESPASEQGKPKENWNVRARSIVEQAENI